jgi:hypothetical protein
MDEVLHWLYEAPVCLLFIMQLPLNMWQHLLQSDCM